MKLFVLIGLTITKQLHIALETHFIFFYLHTFDPKESQKYTTSTLFVLYGIVMTFSVVSDLFFSNY